MSGMLTRACACRCFQAFQPAAACRVPAYVASLTCQTHAPWRLRKAGRSSAVAFRASSAAFRTQPIASSALVVTVPQVSSLPAAIRSPRAGGEGAPTSGEQLARGEGSRGA